MKKVTTLIFASLIIATAMAQSNDTFGLKFNHVALAVKDLKRSAEFYINVMKLPEITNRTANPSIRWISLGEGKELHLITNTEPVTVPKTVHVALSTANFEGFQKHLRDLNIPYGDWGGAPNAVTTRADGIKQIYLQDPDGYWIEINNAVQ
ncbi:MAG: VOC family protein [Cyclobacteriaceae bacterium]